MSKERTVQEATECIKDRYDDVWLEGNCRIGQEELWRERDRVITLLKRGGAYEKMWREISTMYKLPCYGLEGSEVLEIVRFLEQKYLKEVKDNDPEIEE